MNAQTERKAVLFLVVAGGVLWIPMGWTLLGRVPGFMRNLGFLSGPSGTPLAWVLGFLVAALYAGYAVRNIPLVRRHWRAVSWLRLLEIVVAVAAATVEEAFFRRLLMDNLMMAGWSAPGQVLASGVVFGAAHGVWGIATGRWMVGVRVMVATGVVGLGLAVVYWVGERALAPVIVSHFMVTATIQPGITIAAFSGQMRK